MPLSHVITGQVCTVKKCLLGNNYCGLLVFLDVTWTEKHDTLLLGTVFSKMIIQWTALEEVLSPLWRKGQVCLLSSILKITAPSRVQRLGRFACSPLSSGFPSCPVTHFVSCTDMYHLAPRELSLKEPAQGSGDTLATTIAGCNEMLVSDPGGFFHLPASFKLCLTDLLACK